LKRKQNEVYSEHHRATLPKKGQARMPCVSALTKTNPKRR